MKRFGVGLALVALSCTGCSHLPWHKNPPPKAQAPAIQPKPAAPAPAPKPVPPPVTPAPVPPPAPAPVAAPKPVKKHIYHHKPKPAVKPAAAPAAPAAPQANSLVGMLSEGDAAGNPALRKQTSDLIAATQRRLQGVRASRMAARKDTVTQVRLFLSQARQAMAMNDLQGANTLATKAKILVDELLR